MKIYREEKEKYCLQMSVSVSIEKSFQLSRYLGQNLLLCLICFDYLNFLAAHLHLHNFHMYLRNDYRGNRKIK